MGSRGSLVAPHWGKVVEVLGTVVVVVEALPELGTALGGVAVGAPAEQAAASNPAATIPAIRIVNRLARGGTVITLIPTRLGSTTGWRRCRGPADR